MVNDAANNDVFGNLPLKGDWRYRPYDISTFTIAPGEERILIDLRRRGWVVWGFVSHNNPDIRCKIELETGTESYINYFTANDLFNLGAIQAQVNGWWLSRYDSLSNIYNVLFTPAAWWPFYKRLKMTLENKTAIPATIFRVGVLCIEFTEEKTDAK